VKNTTKNQAFLICGSRYSADIWIIRVYSDLVTGPLLFPVGTDDSLHLADQTIHEPFFLDRFPEFFFVFLAAWNTAIDVIRRKIFIAGFWKRFYCSGYWFYPDRWKKPCFSTLNDWWRICFVIYLRLEYHYKKGFPWISLLILSDLSDKHSKQHRDTAISDLRRIGILRKPLFIWDKID
jgi:hypothetical protein